MPEHSIPLRPRKGKPSPATLQAVADAAGVHRSTASRALNSATAHMIGADVVTRVTEAARRLGYRKDALAAGLRTRRTRLVGIVVPDIANPVFGPILSGAETVLAAQGYQALIAHAGGDPARDLNTLEGLIARRVEGLILATVRRDDAVLSRILPEAIPIVLVNRAEDRPRTPAIVPDDEGGMRLAVRHLVDLGHKQIGHLAGPDDVSTGWLRCRGFKSAMREAGLGAEAIVLARAYTRDAGQSAAAALLDRYELTAVAAANDLLAIGLYQELRARGLACPRDMSVTGFNDMPMVDMVDPPLTSVAIHHHRLGEEAAQALLRHIADTAEKSERRAIETELVVRASTSRPGASGS